MKNKKLRRLKSYQVDTVDKLVSSVSDLLSKIHIPNKLVVFQSPTGSGKTFMAAKFIEEIVEDYPEYDMCFLWLSIGKGELHKQSRNAVKRIFGPAPACNLLEETFNGGKSFIERNEVVFANWEKL
jgi:type III restriction enzyme